MAEFGSYYSMMGESLFRSYVMATVITLVLALVTGAVKFVVGRIRGRNND